MSRIQGRRSRRRRRLESNRGRSSRRCITKRRRPTARLINEAHPSQTDLLKPQLSRSIEDSVREPIMVECHE